MIRLSILSVLITIKVIISCFYLKVDFVSIYALLTILGLIFILMSFSFLIKKQKIFLIAINIILSLVLLGDCIYFNYFNVPLNIYTIFQTSNLQGLAGSIAALFRPQYILFFIDIPFLIHLLSPVRLSKKYFYITMTLGIFLVLIFPLYMINKEMNPIRRFDPQRTLECYGLLGYHVIDTIHFFRDRRVTLNNQEKERITTWFGNKVKQPSNTTYKSIGKDKNLIIIQVESLQNFIIHQKVNGEYITPCLNNILKNSIYFPNIYPQTREGNSSDAELLVNTSLYPVQKGSTFFRFPDNDYISLAGLLKNEGYSTLAIHGDEKTFWNRNRVYPHLGFDDFISLEDLNLDDEIGMGLSDLSMFRQSLPILKATYNPFYAYIITLTSHYPFEMPEDKVNLDVPVKIKDTLIGNYIESINYTDKCIGYFLELLKENELLENSIIVIYGDHDGILNKNDIVNYVGNIDHNKWVREYVPVPLIIYNPSIKGEKMDRIGGEVDIMPTITYLMGIESDKYAMGHNLLTVQEGSVIVPKGDYRERELCITDDKIYTELNSYQKEVLKISELGIKGNYFKDKL